MARPTHCTFDGIRTYARPIAQPKRRTRREKDLRNMWMPTPAEHEAFVGPKRPPPLPPRRSAELFVDDEHDGVDEGTSETSVDTIDPSLTHDVPAQVRDLLADAAVF